MSCKQEVGIGPDQLEALLRLAGEPVGDELRVVAGRAAGRVEDRLAGQHLRVGRIAPCRHREVAAVEGHEVEHGVVRPPARRRPAGRGRRPRRRCSRPSRRDAAWSRCRCRRRRRRRPGRGSSAARPCGRSGPSIGRPSAADQTVFGRPLMPSPSRSSGSASARMSASGTASMQAEADHLRRHPRRDLHVGGSSRPVGEIGGRVARAAQRHRLAVAERHRHLGIVDGHAALGARGRARRRSGAGRRRSAPAASRDSPRPRPSPPAARPCCAGTESRRNMPTAGSSGPVGGCAAAVLEVAGLAGAGVEQRPEAVGGLRRGGRGHPELAEEAVADLEVELALEGHVGRGAREGVGVRRLLAGRGAAGQRLEALGRGEVGSRRRHRRHPRRLGGGARRRRCGARQSAGAQAAPPRPRPAAGSAPRRAGSRWLLEDRVGVVEAVGALEGDRREIERETARSIERVWAISALTPPITSASPAALPVASSWS